MWPPAASMQSSPRVPSPRHHFRAIPRPLPPPPAALPWHGGWFGPRMGRHSRVALSSMRSRPAALRSSPSVRGPAIIATIYVLDSGARAVTATVLALHAYATYKQFG